jgi:UDP-N-acetylmuramate--alanine ligase
MSGIAEVLHHLGYVVSGSDAQDGAAMARLRSLGITATVGHAAQHIAGAQVLVLSSAIAESNPEVIAAREARIPVVPRAAMLAELMRFKHGIAVAGTHGKTTTTSLVTSILAQAGWDPTFVIGGKLNSAGVNARLGNGEHIVVEADESDGSFLNLTPLQAIVTNIDEDHMVTYGHERARLDQAFIDFLHRMPFYGQAVMCGDDPGVQAILPRVQRPVLTYGFESGVDLRATEVRADAMGMRFVVNSSQAEAWPVHLSLAGEHNVRNSLAAIGVAMGLGVPMHAIQSALAQFKGVGRRFEQVGKALLPGGTARVIDDYGHHPAELAAVLAAARGAYPGQRIVLAFQPHRYTRTRDCFHDFVAVLAKADALLLTEVYSAGEAPIAGADGQSLCRAVTQAAPVSVCFVPQVNHLPAAIVAELKPGDVVLCMGAGSIGQTAARVVALASGSERQDSQK